MQATTEPLGAPRRPRKCLRLPAAVRRLYEALRPSEQHFRTVWLVIITPPPVLGHLTTLITTTSWRKAESHYLGAVADVVDGRSKACVKLAPYRTHLSDRALRDELYSLEGGLEGLPAAREFVPGLGSFILR